MFEIEPKASEIGLVVAVDPSALVRSFVGSLKPATRKAYLYSLDCFREWIGCADLNTLAAQICRLSGAEAKLLLLKYTESLTGLTPSTVNARTQGIRSLVRLARMLG